jgi:hypothetical protein
MSAMLDHMSKESEEGLHLKGWGDRLYIAKPTSSQALADVIKQMGVVADHMNEMQRLCEMYWPLIHNMSNDPKLHEVS